jgi:hypothetical protein
MPEAAIAGYTPAPRDKMPFEPHIRVFVRLPE